MSLRDGGYLHEYYASDARTVSAGIRARVEEIKDSLDRLASSFETELNEKIRRSAHQKS